MYAMVYITFTLSRDVVYFGILEASDQSVLREKTCRVFKQN